MGLFVASPNLRGEPEWTIDGTVFEMWLGRVWAYRVSLPSIM